MGQQRHNVVVEGRRFLTTVYMAWPLWPKNTVKYHDTPQGILTESGIWYGTTVNLLNEYAAEVFEREPIEAHLARADTWIRSPHTLSAWLLALGLIYYDPWQIAVVVLGFFLGWQILAAALVNRGVSTLLRILDAVLMQAILYAGTMSILAMTGRYQAVAVGLIGFICFRWGILSYLMRPLIIRCWKAMYRLPVPDHILRAFIVRSALRHGINLADFADIEQEIIQNVFKKKAPRGRK